ncbi:MAG: hypothetical protein ABI162_08460 [Luteolibacter sp.]
MKITHLNASLLDLLRRIRDGIANALPRPAPVLVPIPVRRDQR